MKILEEQTEKDKIDIHTSSLKRIKNSNEMLTDFIIDDIFEYIFPDIICTRCSFVKNTILSVYELFKPIKQEYWHYNMTGPLFGKDVWDPSKFESELTKFDFHEKIGIQDKNLRKLSIELKQSIENGNRYIYMPVCIAKHFWLYIIDTKRKAIEIYDSLRGYSKSDVIPDELIIKNSSQYYQHVYKLNSEDEKSADIIEFNDPIYNKILRYKEMSKKNIKTQADVHMSIMWYLKNYLDLDCVLVQYGSGFPMQLNGNDCGVFICLFVFLKHVFHSTYTTIMYKTSQDLILPFRKFLYKSLIQFCKDRQ